MYILIKAEAPLGLAMVAAAHASLAAYLKLQDDPDVKAWLSGPFRKVVCAVTAQQFEDAKAFPDGWCSPSRRGKAGRLPWPSSRARSGRRDSNSTGFSRNPPRPPFNTRKRLRASPICRAGEKPISRVRGGCFNRPLIVQASNGVRTVEGKPEPELNFTFGAHFPPNLWSSQLSEYAALRGLEWARSPSPGLIPPPPPPIKSARSWGRDIAP